MINYNCQLEIGDPPNPAGFVDDAIEVDYFIKALETRLKYCPNDIVGITISAESARRILKALKNNKNEGGKTMKFRKKPVVIEAYQTDKPLDIETLEGTMHADPGDWIITGVHGEQYPCKPDIFALTYEPCEEEE